MNRLRLDRRAQVIGCLTDGMSIRGTVRLTGVAKNTVTKLLVDIGTACAAYQDAEFRNLDLRRVEVDEIWALCYSNAKNAPEDFIGTLGYGDVCTWVALDADTKLVPTWLVGERTIEDCYTFMADLRDRSRVGNRIQLTTDGLGIYAPVVDAIWRNGIDVARIVKEYKSATGEERRRYSPTSCSSIQKKLVCRDPDAALASNSYVERQNLSMRMGLRRFTRLTNGISKKVDNLARAVSLFYSHHNLCRPHQTLSGRGRGQVTPAMAAGVESYPWSLTQLAELLESN